MGPCISLCEGRLKFSPHNPPAGSSLDLEAWHPRETCVAFPSTASFSPKHSIRSQGACSRHIPQGGCGAFSTKLGCDFLRRWYLARFTPASSLTAPVDNQQRLSPCCRVAPRAFLPEARSSSNTPFCVRHILKAASSTSCTGCAGARLF